MMAREALKLIQNSAINLQKGLTTQRENSGILINCFQRHCKQSAERINLNLSFSLPSHKTTVCWIKNFQSAQCSRMINLFIQAAFVDGFFSLQSPPGQRDNILRNGLKTPRISSLDIRLCLGKKSQMMARRFAARFNFSSALSISVNLSFYLEILISSTGAFFMLSGSWALKINDWKCATKDFVLLWFCFFERFRAQIVLATLLLSAPGFALCSQSRRYWSISPIYRC